MSNGLRNDNRPLALLLFALLFSSYMLVYSGLITSADETSLVAVAESLADRGEFNTDQLVWADWDLGWMAQGSPGREGHIYSKKGIGISFLIWPFYQLGQVGLPVGSVHAALLFNPLVCALTGVVLWATARRWGYTSAQGVLLGLIGGWATLLWPYSKTLFLEPVTGLSLAAAIFFITGLPSRRQALAAGGALAIAIALRLTNVLAGPLLALYLGYRCLQTGVGYRRAAWRLALLGLLPLLAALGVAYYNWHRFGDWSSAGYTARETFSTPLWTGLGGLLFSPGESLFLFSPVLLFALPGLAWLWRTQRAEALLLASLVLLNLILFGLWYDWRGGLAWGPRFMVPIVPLLVLALLPLLNTWVCKRGGWRRWSLLATILLSVAVQLAAVAVPYLQTDTHWPVLAAFARFNLARFDSAWMLATPEVQWMVMVAFGFILLLSAALLAAALSGQRGRTSLWPGSAGLTLLALWLAVWSVGRIYPDQRWGAGEDYRRLAAHLHRVTSPADAIVVDTHTTTDFFLNYDRSRARRYHFLRSDTLIPQATQLLAHLVDSVDTIWLVSHRPAHAGMSRPEEGWLDQHAFRVGEDTFSDYARLIRYHVPLDTRLQIDTIDVLYTNGLRLHQVWRSSRQVWAPGQVVALALVWRLGATTPQALSTSVQLLDASGQLRWQRDLPLTTQPSSLETVDRYGLLLPPTLEAGQYRLIAVVYDPVTGNRLHTQTPALEAGDQTLLLGTLRID